MKSLLISAVLSAAAISPSVAYAATPASQSAAGKQSVYTTVSHTFIENSDGSETQITTYTSYYVFGVR